MNKNFSHKVKPNAGLLLKELCSGLLLFVFCFQMFSFSLNAQTLRTEREEKTQIQVLAENSENKTETLPDLEENSETKTKIAPDLEENVNEFFVGGKPDKTQKVIIKLNDKNPEENSNYGILMSDLTVQKEINSKLRVLGGRFRKSFSTMKMMTAELPLSKIRELAEDENVEYISPDRLIKGNGLSSHSHYFKTTGAMEGSDEPLLSTADGAGIGVAVIDSGIDVNHKLLQADRNHPGVVYSKSFTATSATTDRYGHGTHVAALLAGNKEFADSKYEGIAPGVKIINLSVLDSYGRGSVSSAIAAVNWVIANKSAYNIRVINMSLGTPAQDSYINDPLCQAVRRASNAGIVVVVAAGNNGKDDAGNKMYGSINSPGIEPSAITVGAANSYGSDRRRDDGIASFSSKGPTRGYKVVNGVKKYDNLIKPDLVAPGNKLISAISSDSVGNSSSIVSKNPSLDTRNSSNQQEKLMYMSGTSMATPLVTGAVAMMLQIKPNLTPNLVKAILMYTAQQLNGYNTFEQGAGLLNVAGSMKMTNIVKSNVSSLSNGSSMMSSFLLLNYSTYGGENIYWGKGIITNYAVLSGDNLMKYYQGMYGNGVIMGDSTPFVNGQLTRLTTLTTSGLNLSSGSLISNGVIMGDGIPFISSNVLGDGITLGNGVIMGDGTLFGDGVLMSDTVASRSILGDATTAMSLND